MWPEEVVGEGEEGDARVEGLRAIKKNAGQGEDASGRRRVGRSKGGQLAPCERQVCRKQREEQTRSRSRVNVEGDETLRRVEGRASGSLAATRPNCCGNDLHRKRSSAPCLEVQSERRDLRGYARSVFPYRGYCSNKWLYLTVNLAMWRRAGETVGGGRSAHLST